MSFTSQSRDARGDRPHRLGRLLAPLDVTRASDPAQDAPPDFVFLAEETFKRPETDAETREKPEPSPAAPGLAQRLARRALSIGASLDAGQTSAPRSPQSDAFPAASPRRDDVAASAFSPRSAPAQAEEKSASTAPNAPPQSAEQHLNEYAALSAEADLAEGAIPQSDIPAEADAEAKPRTGAEAVLGAAVGGMRALGRLFQETPGLSEAVNAHPPLAALAALGRAVARQAERDGPSSPSPASARAPETDAPFARLQDNADAFRAAEKRDFYDRPAAHKARERRIRLSTDEAALQAKFDEAQQSIEAEKRVEVQTPWSALAERDDARARPLGALSASEGRLVRTRGDGAPIVAKGASEERSGLVEPGQGGKGAAPGAGAAEKLAKGALGKVVERGIGLGLRFSPPAIGAAVALDGGGLAPSNAPPVPLQSAAEGEAVWRFHPGREQPGFLERKGAGRGWAAYRGTRDAGVYDRSRSLGDAQPSTVVVAETRGAPGRVVFELREGADPSTILGHEALSPRQKGALLERRFGLDPFRPFAAKGEPVTGPEPYVDVEGFSVTRHTTDREIDSDPLLSANAKQNAKAARDRLQADRAQASADRGDGRDGRGRFRGRSPDGLRFGEGHEKALAGRIEKAGFTVTRNPHLGFQMAGEDRVFIPDIIAIKKKPASNDGPSAQPPDMLYVVEGKQSGELTPNQKDGIYALFSGWVVTPFGAVAERGSLEAARLQAAEVSVWVERGDRTVVLRSVDDFLREYPRYRPKSQ